MKVVVEMTVFRKNLSGSASEFVPLLVRGFKRPAREEGCEKNDQLRYHGLLLFNWAGYEAIDSFREWQEPGK